MAPTVATNLRVTWRWQRRSATCTSLQRGDKEQSDNGPSRSLGGVEHRIPRLLRVRFIVVLLLLRPGYEPNARQESGTVMSGIDSTASFCRQSRRFHSWTQDIFARTAATASKVDEGNVAGVTMQMLRLGSSTNILAAMSSGGNDEQDLCLSELRKKCPVLRQVFHKVRFAKLLHRTCNS